MTRSLAYQTGWNDGYAEGYGCKLADATEPFNPQSLGRPEAVERMANVLQLKFRDAFKDRPSAIGCARLLVVAAQLGQAQ